MGIGFDLVDIERIDKIVAREEDSFIRALLSDRERHLYEQFRNPKRRTEWIAGRFSAKEAAAKALGTGWTGIVTPKCLEILPDSLGKPELTVPAEVGKRFEFPIRSHVTITHTKHTAAAIVFIEKMEIRLEGEAGYFREGIV
ncbi:holo-ACP synthase [Paenibacillus filicis]|uniref:Holo-[acyl-carrier-protein] synthase n=1 Tax=Paenibacillus gyeongsangnamensis TaxID=3388067 RepID=A0ABT4Q8F7_9BACL|nr:holo-ACP synthase [Paenibacillus filicis]MCZ8513150.1 holo-ACP synthase [Paenibacillus filicis]